MRQRRRNFEKYISSSSCGAEEYAKKLFKYFFLILNIFDIFFICDTKTHIGLNSLLTNI